MGGRSTINIHEGTQPRVLVVDDNPLNCGMVKVILDRESIRCAIVSSGEDALDELKRSTFDLVLLDIEMPGMSGYEVLRQLRERQSDLAFLPIILLTGHTDHETRLRGLSAGATDFLTKPFDPAELGARIRNHIAAKRLYDKLMLTNQLLEQERSKIFQAQLDLLPRAMPRRADLRFGATYLASSVASGDYYDVLIRPDGRVVLAIADVCGHGIASAMQMSILRATLHARIAHRFSLVEIMRDLNGILRHSLDEYSFVTFYLAEYDAKTGTLLQVSAGHHPPLRHRIATNQIEEVPLETSCPLGIDDEIELVECMAKLGPGDRLIVYTDGLVEQSGPDGSVFDLDQVKKSLLGASGLSAQQAVDRLVRDHSNFSGLVTPTDDVTVLAVDVFEAPASLR